MSRLSKISLGLLFTSLAHAQIAIYVISGPNLPSHCSVTQGNVYNKTTGGVGVQGLYICGLVNDSWIYVGSAAGGITGSGTPQTLSKFAGSTSLTNSSITDNGSLVTISEPLLLSGTGQTTFTFYDSGGSPTTPLTGQVPVCITVTSHACTIAWTTPSSVTIASTSNILKGDGAGNAVAATQNGTGNVVLTSSPALVTPSLGVASATSLNKLTLTSPATGATITIADGKTLTVSNTLTATGTDGSSIAFGTGGTVLYNGGALGTPSSATLTNATGLPPSGLTTHTTTINSTSCDLGSSCSITTGSTSNQNLRTIGAQFGDFSSGATAISSSQIACVTVPFAGTITGVYLIGTPSGSITVDVKTVAHASFTGPASTSSITASDIPVLSSATTFSDTTLTGWTTSVTAGTDVCFYESGAATTAGASISVRIAAN